MSLALELLAISAGQPAPLGHWQGQPVLSGIRKAPLQGDTVDVRTTNIAGDGQADMTVHGGADKAVYAYPADHWPWWKAEADFNAAPASFGENLTLRGADEHAICIGDQFAWGQVILEVSQPRAPCFKFAMFTGREDLSARMTISTRTGWYFRVLKPGAAPLKGPLVRLHTGENQPSVRDAFIAVYHPRVMSDVVEKVLAAPALSSAWREGLNRRLTAALNR